MNCLPQAAGIYRKVAMRQLVTHSGDFAPRNLRILLANRCRNHFRCFANDLQSLHYGEYFLIIQDELIEGDLLDKPAGLARGIQNIMK